MQLLPDLKDEKAGAFSVKSFKAQLNVNPFQSLKCVKRRTRLDNSDQGNHLCQCKLNLSSLSNVH